MFGLVVNDLTQIKPNYEAMVKGGTLRITDEGYAQGNENRTKREQTAAASTTATTKLVAKSNDWTSPVESNFTKNCGGVGFFSTLSVNVVVVIVFLSQFYT